MSSQEGALQGPIHLAIPVPLSNIKGRNFFPEVSCFTLVFARLYGVYEMEAVMGCRLYFDKLRKMQDSKLHLQTTARGCQSTPNSASQFLVGCWPLEEIEQSSSGWRQSP